MVENLFLDREQKATDEMLSDFLGKSFLHWIELKELLHAEHADIREEWKYYGKKYGWSMKMLLKKKNLFFFVPQNNFFIIGYIFGDKAVAQIQKSKLPQKIINELVEARKYAEGRGIRIQVKSKKDINNVLELVKSKIN